MRLAEVSLLMVFVAVDLVCMLAQALLGVQVLLAEGADLALRAAGAGLGAGVEALLVAFLFLGEDMGVVLCLFGKRQPVVGGVHLHAGRHGGEGLTVVVVAGSFFRRFSFINYI